MEKMHLGQRDIRELEFSESTFCVEGKNKGSSYGMRTLLVGVRKSKEVVWLNRSEQGEVLYQR